MAELLIVAILLGAFGLVCLVFYLWEHPKKSTQEQRDDFSGRVTKAKKELAKLLGAFDVTDTAKLDQGIANWIGCPEKSWHLAGLSADMVLATIEKAESQAKRGREWMPYANRNLASAEDLLGNLTIQISLLKPRQ